MDRHVRWAQLLLYLWFNPSRRKNSQKSQMLKKSLPKRKINNFNMVAQSQKTWFVELVFGYTPSYTWSPPVLTHHPTRNTCSKSSTCPKTACLNKTNWKMRRQKQAHLLWNAPSATLDHCKQITDSHVWLSWFICHETSDSAGNLLPSHQPALLHGTADNTNTSSPLSSEGF